MAAALGLVLWHGGYRAPAQVVLAVVAAAGTLLVRPRSLPLRSILWLGLAVAAAASLASLAWHHDRTSVAPALAVTGVVVIVAAATTVRPLLDRFLPVVVLGLGMTVATAGLAGLVLRAEPLAERIDGVWRAGGTFEYPPALGVFTVCALAYALALHATGTLDRITTLVAAGVLVAGAAATFDRVTWVETVAVAALFAAREPATRRTVALLATVAATGAVAALAISHPSQAALERHLRHGALSSRRTAWSHAWHAAGRHPLLGYGPGRYLASYADSSSNGAPVAEAHNAVLEESVEAGLIAGLGVAAALAAMLATGVAAAARGGPVRAAHGVTATVVALSGLYDFTWSFAPLVLLGALAAVAAGARDP
jgi:putative inorganic carbon (hco3(-)) transporter